MNQSKPFSYRMCNKCIQFTSFAHFLPTRPQRNADRVHFSICSTQCSPTRQKLFLFLCLILALGIRLFHSRIQFQLISMKVHFQYRSNTIKPASIARKGHILHAAASKLKCEITLFLTLFQMRKTSRDTSDGSQNIV